MMRHVAVVVGVLVFTSFAFSQDEGRWDVSLNGVGLWGKQTSGNGTSQIPTKNVGFLATVRFHIGERSALEVNWSRGNDSQKFITSTLQYRVLTTLNEFTGAYVFRPMQTDRFKPFLLVGGGAIVFNPDNTLIFESAQALEGVRQTRPAILYGGGVDYHLIRFLSLRLQYRGLFYSPPDYKLPGLFTGGHGHMAEPGVGLVVSF